MLTNELFHRMNWSLLPEFIHLSMKGVEDLVADAGGAGAHDFGSFFLENADGFVHHEALARPAPADDGHLEAGVPLSYVDDRQGRGPPERAFTQCRPAALLRMADVQPRCHELLLRLQPLDPLFQLRYVRRGLIDLVLLRQHVLKKQGEPGEFPEEKTKAGQNPGTESARAVRTSSWRTLEADLWWWEGMTEASLKQRPFMWILRFRSTVFRSSLTDSPLLLLFFISLSLLQPRMSWSAKERGDLDGIRSSGTKAGRGEEGSSVMNKARAATYKYRVWVVQGVADATASIKAKNINCSDDVAKERTAKPPRVVNNNDRPWTKSRREGLGPARVPPILDRIFYVSKITFSPWPWEWDAIIRFMNRVRRESKGRFEMAPTMDLILLESRGELSRYWELNRNTNRGSNSGWDFS